jgi:hypothetical protein
MLLSRDGRECFGEWAGNPMNLIENWGGMIAALLVALQTRKLPSESGSSSGRLQTPVRTANAVATVEITEQKEDLRFLAEGLGIDEGIVCSSLQAAV